MLINETAHTFVAMIRVESGRSLQENVTHNTLQYLCQNEHVIRINHGSWLSELLISLKKVKEN